MRSRCPVVFKIAGSGPDEQMLRARLASHSNVEFLGRLGRSQVTQLIQASDCIVVPSLVPESFGLVAAESLACGVPVVATKIGGLSELVDASQGGVLIAPDQGAEAFAQALQRLACSPDERRRLGQRGRRFAETKLDIKGTTRQLVEIYESLLRESQGAMES